ncbi:MAG TPA: glycosyltransferase family 2 protein [Dehalococcoidia bacterium]|nr:glycosyltransferase family 2 protein [Dehalococcoidia bacterium]
MATLSVVIVSYNVADLLRGCLRSVYASRGVEHEVWVVDNCSSDGSAALVAREFPQAQLLVSDCNGGYAYANNLALRRARGDYLLLLNPDTVVQPDALAEMVAFMESRPDVGMVGPKLVRDDGSLDLACRRSFPSPAVSFYRMAGLSRRFPRSRRFGRYNLTYLDPDQEAEVDSVVGAFMMVRRQAVEQVGLLDESFFLYGEDLDWAMRVKKAGWKVVYNPRVVVLHRKASSSTGDIRRATAEFYRSMLIFYKKHYAAQNLAPLNWLILGAIYLRGSLAYAMNTLLPPQVRKVNY